MYAFKLPVDLLRRCRDVDHRIQRLPIYSCDRSIASEDSLGCLQRYWAVLVPSRCKIRDTVSQCLSTQSSSLAVHHCHLCTNHCFLRLSELKEKMSKLFRVALQNVLSRAKVIPRSLLIFPD